MNPANQNAAAPAAGQQGQQQAPQRPNIMKMILIYMVMNYLMNYFFKGNQNQATSAGGTGYMNLFQEDEPFEFKMYVSNSRVLGDNESPVWEETGLAYNYDKNNLREKVLYFNIDELLAKDSEPELYAHFHLTSTRSPASANYSDFEPYLTNGASLTGGKKDKSGQQENLLFSETKETQDEKSTPSIAKNDTTEEEKYPHLKTKIWVQLVHDTNVYAPGQLPPHISPRLVKTEGQNNIYLPTIDAGQFWLRKKDFALIDSSAENKTLNTTVYFNTYWIYKYMMEAQMGQANQIYKEWGVGENNLDELKEMVLEANPYLFGITMIVSTLHSVFEFLALKNDIAFWKNVESHKGLSLRSLWVSLITEIIVILYLFDNDTSYLILISSVAGLGVTIWKILKTSKFKKREDKKFPFYELDYQEAYKSTTMEYDQAASKYLIWALIPLLAGYTIYSLIYEKHKGWYSFVVQTLVGFIYVFGFIEMTPQLYINYKLKSVEHLPWRVLVYKFLNTIVDDLFAFVITMPWLKRLSCFRDDIIFVIYVYQRWIYRVDKNRDPYGNILKKEEGQKEQKAIKEGVVSNKKGNEKESNVVTQRNVEEAKENNSPTVQGSQSKGQKMKKKKVE